MGGVFELVLPDVVEEAGEVAGAGGEVGVQVLRGDGGAGGRQGLGAELGREAGGGTAGSQPSADMERNTEELFHEGLETRHRRSRR